MHPLLPLATRSPWSPRTSCLPHRLRRWLLLQGNPTRLLPLLYGYPHHPPPRTPRFRLRRHSPRWQCLCPWPRLQGVSYRWVLGMVEGSCG
ncbi:hypothetical protein LINPERPRIM_LOCUS38928 [Linum perenne]